MSDNLTTQQSGSDDSLTALVPATEWIRQWGTINLDESKDVAVDKGGNVYVTGYTDGSVSGTNVGLEWAWLTKYDSNGTRLWTQELESDKLDISYGVATDSAGSVYITGGTWGDLEGSNAGGNDAWVAKYDSSGTRKWLRQFGSINNEVSSNVAVDAGGNVYISGSDGDAWLAKYDSSGDRLWFEQFDFGDSEASEDIAVDSAGNIYVTGSIRVEDTQRDTWIVKYNSNGARQWWKQLDSASGLFSSIAVDSTGNIYVSGETDTKSFSGSSEDEDAWIAKYDTDGDRQWWEELGVTTERTRSYGVAVDRDDNPYITGQITSEIDAAARVWAINPFVAKYDGLGNRRWIQQLGSSEDRSTSWGIDVDGDGNVYVGGNTEDDFGASNAGHLDAWLAKLAPYTSNSLPAIVNNKELTLNEGGSATISSDLLQITDAENSPITYTIAALPANGIMKLNDTEMKVNDTFTQAALNAGNLIYIHDGSEVISDGFSFTVPGKNGSQIKTTDFEIAVNPVNDAPTDIRINGSTVDSNSANGAVIGSLTTVDADNNDTHSYTLVDDSEGRFAIDGDRLVVADETKIDYSDSHKHTVRIRSTDNGNPSLSLEEDFNISIIGETGEPIDEWIQQLETVGSEEVKDVTVDEEGNVYLVGATEKDLAGTNAGGKDLWLAKYDPSSTRLWVQQWGTVDDDSPAEVGVDSNGNVYIVGASSRLYGSYDFESDGFIVKYDSSGNQEWVETLASVGGADYVSNVAVDSAGYIYVIGSAGDLGVEDFASEAYGEFFGKYAPNGDRLWLKQEENFISTYTTIKYDEIATDSANNVYIARKYQWAESPPSASVIKYDSSGNEQWNQNLELQTNKSVEGIVLNSIAVDGAGNVYVSGENEYVYWYYTPDLELENRAVLTKLDSSGNQQWQNLWSGSTEGVDVDREGNVYVPMPQAINKYDPEGNFLWEQQLKSPLSSYSDLELDGDGQAYLVGGELEPLLAKLDLNARAIASKGLTLDEGASFTITSSQLEITDTGDDNAPTYVISALPTNGSLLLNNIEVPLNDAFTQADIDAGNLTYIHDGSETTKDNFSFTLAEATYGLGVETLNTVFPITVNSVNDAPTDITLSENSIAENSATGTVVAQLTTADSDSETYTYSLIEDAGDRFAIEGSELKVADGSNLDFEAANSHTIKIRTVDNGEPVQNFEKEFSIELTDVADNTVTSTTNHRLGATKENLNLVGEDAIDGTGNNLDNRISGNSAKNRIWGKDGSDVLIGGGGNDVLMGNEGRDRLAGNGGNDLLNGGPGIDTTNGGPGNDTYIVNHTRDVVKEGTNRGTDVVKSSADYNLGANIENLNLIGRDAINGVGNNLDNRINGNSAKNRIWGKDGSDVLIGGGGNDVLIGNEGRDRLIGNRGRDFLNGGPGIDTMNGGPGNDTYIVNHTRDVVKEGTNRGTDVVKSSADYNLAANIENLNLVGRDAINGVGNNLDNRISGNNAKNRIIGKAGNDILIGRGGKDVLIGDKGSDRLIGNQGNDLLNGGLDNDTLIGGGGSDRFIFNTGKSYRKASPGRDVIRDFKSRDNDRIILDKTTFGALDSKAGRGFSVIAEFDVVNRDAAVASSDAVIVYNENNGKLFYNANGSNSGLGAGGVFAVLDNSPELQANDFVIRG